MLVLVSHSDKVTISVNFRNSIISLMSLTSILSEGDFH